MTPYGVAVAVAAVERSAMDCIEISVSTHSRVLSEQKSTK